MRRCKLTERDTAETGVPSARSKITLALTTM
jgi:hypothetical protein